MPFSLVHRDDHHSARHIHVYSANHCVLTVTSLGNKNVAYCTVISAAQQIRPAEKRAPTVAHHLRQTTGTTDQVW